VGEPEYGIRIRRVFDAPPERVWAEWTTPEAFADWFGGPDSEVPLESVSMDVRQLEGRVQGSERTGATRLYGFRPASRRTVRARDRRACRSRRRPHRDALRAARFHVTRAVRVHQAGLGHLLRSYCRTLGRKRRPGRRVVAMHRPGLSGAYAKAPRLRVGSRSSSPACPRRTRGIRSRRIRLRGGLPRLLPGPAHPSTSRRPPRQRSPAPRRFRTDRPRRKIRTTSGSSACVRLTDFPSTGAGEAELARVPAPHALKAEGVVLVENRLQSVGEGVGAARPRGEERPNYAGSGWAKTAAERATGDA
jgi:hypothetical protein